ncbi:hypothetical protein K435DRAFT_470786 [Dendrothele bispora CBS 962.96]|uniref:Uncharacterized protein n=1 Tax=Dendrothele bispora (strain CBS 962.96) TaxID=1314807 RepID=A0A4V4HGS9_DENBC|nr:hypothetical protein K435DRAFT_470786 [Dendrothele bispora CBS 962.96]
MGSPVSSDIADYLSGRRIGVDGPVFLSSSTSELLCIMLVNEKQRALERSAVSNKLLQEVDEQKGVIARIFNILSPIRRLPPELLIEIFLTYAELKNTRAKSETEVEEDDGEFTGPVYSDLVHGSDNVDLPHFLLLSQICFQWRNIVQQESRLWSRVSMRITHKQSLPDKKLVHGWLQRSGSFPLDISISTRDHTDLMECFIPFCERWRSLDLDMRSKGFEVLFDRKPLSLPNLRRLVIRKPIEPRSDPFAERLLGPRYDVPFLGKAFVNATQLSVFKYFPGRSYPEHNNIPSLFKCQLPFTHITTLCLVYDSVAPVSLQGILRACTLIQTCDLLNIPDGLGDVALPSSTLPDLRKLSLEFTGRIGSPRILNDLCLPKLESLALRHLTVPNAAATNAVPYSFIPNLLALRDRSGFQLHTFVFQRPAIQCSEPREDIKGLVAFLKLNPNLEVLDLEDCSFDISLLCRELKIDVRSSLEPLVRNLTRLRIAQSQGVPDHQGNVSGHLNPGIETDNNIAEMVLSRWNLPRSSEQSVSIYTSDMPVNGALVKQLKGGFTFQAYSRDLALDTMSRLNVCEMEGMPLRVTVGKQFG